ncbi:MAG: hypothetical protein H7318_04740 [Oligoflexus sp.]|nr:hypothetical protein [Oligoflexus sp.]
MKIEVETSYVLTEADVCRLKNLSRTLSLAIAELLEARCQESLSYASFADEDDCKDQPDFDLNEIMTYEQVYELRQSLSGTEAD